LLDTARRAKEICHKLSDWCRLLSIFAVAISPASRVSGFGDRPRARHAAGLDTNDFDFIGQRRPELPVKIPVPPATSMTRSEAGASAIMTARCEMSRSG
jgi:hypothetical protein